MASKKKRARKPLPPADPAMLALALEMAIAGPVTDLKALRSDAGVVAVRKPSLALLRATALPASLRRHVRAIAQERRGGKP